MAVSKRSVGRKALLLLAVVAGPGLACKSTGEPRPSEPVKTCPAELLLPQTSTTFTLSCTGFTPKDQKLHVNGQVNFVSDCDTKVFISFSNPKTLFTSGVETITLEHKGDSQQETATSVGDCHEMCFGSTTCPPAESIDSKTGSLDVYTSGPQPDPSKAQSP